MSETEADEIQSSTTVIEGKWVTRSHEVTTDQISGHANPARAIKQIGQALLDEVHQILADRLLHFKGDPIKAQFIIRVSVPAYRFPDECIDDTPENRQAFQDAVERANDTQFIALEYFPRQESPSE